MKFRRRAASDCKQAKRLRLLGRHYYAAAAASRVDVHCDMVTRGIFTSAKDLDRKLAS